MLYSDLAAGAQALYQAKLAAGSSAGTQGGGGLLGGGRLGQRRGLSTGRPHIVGSVLGVSPPHCLQFPVLPTHEAAPSPLNSRCSHTTAALCKVEFRRASMRDSLGPLECSLVMCTVA